ncbi:hypothetical protein [Xenorhabdus eapokensis]|uniref:Uncharacterized protein n=1 Tax=Xenorhabdus eapokensis TaxID=1873482 RepID=A0A1Q5TKR4_9GAMM|nr:hypothetical protein [Xenorhabdus eapokensis]OKP00810.1 hypothetical protein Xedl_03124 [Xenorhabdus eapokensis]
MTIVFELLRLCLPLFFLFSLGIGLWALGQGLRRKGYGDRLDAIAVHIKKFQCVTGRMFAPLLMVFIGAGRGLSHIPLLGSRRGRLIWDALEKQAQNTSPPRPKKKKQAPKNRN